VGWWVEIIRDCMSAENEGSCWEVISLFLVVVSLVHFALHFFSVLFNVFLFDRLERRPCVSFSVWSERFAGLLLVALGASAVAFLFGALSCFAFGVSAALKAAWAVGE
jgi:hypothetical protein